MDRLCDEVIQLIFFELVDPGPITQVSTRFHEFSKDPYVRAHYFLTRYGPIQAMFWALARGRVINERVLDILLTSGAHLSRYLVQIAMHHYFRTQAHSFIKTAWVRSVPFPVFTYFLSLAAAKYGDIPCGKGEDDGSVFSIFLKESRFPAHLKSVKWEQIRDMLEQHKFIPFFNKDPIMAQFPLALAIDPRLLPLASANGFSMDDKYRDFVFRKMFERPAAPSDTHGEDIVHNVRELCRLDPKMFLSRTVAAEICMEVTKNEHAYSALKRLNKSGDLLFELSSVVEDLIKLFVKVRSITVPSTMLVLRQLYADFPSTDTTVRLVLLLTVFLSDNCIHTTPTILKGKLELLGLDPSRRDIVNVLINPFIERYSPILDYAKCEAGLGMTSKEIKDMVIEVAIKCLELGYKGKMLKKMCEAFTFLPGILSNAVVERYQIALDDLPPGEDERACKTFEAKLCRDFFASRVETDTDSSPAPDMHDGDANGDDTEKEFVGMPGRGDGGMVGDEGESEEASELGNIGMDSLSTMIRQDEMIPLRGRRRMLYPYIGGSESNLKLQYPIEPLQVGRWIKNQFGARSAVTAVFMTHAVINESSSIFQHYMASDTRYITRGPLTTNHVPVTLKHFQILARLGRAPHWTLYSEIELGAEFYASENDYLGRPTAPEAKKLRVKREASQARILDTDMTVEEDTAESACEAGTTASPRPRKRPRRSATSGARSYVVPDSDDDAIADDDDEDAAFGVSADRRVSGQTRKRKVESSLEKWITHLAILLKEEQKKFKERRKHMEETLPGEKIRLPKNEFFKSLSSHLRDLRKHDQAKRMELYGTQVLESDYSDGDDDEYHSKTSRAKRRKIVR